MGAPTQKVAPSQKAEVGSALLPKDGDRAHENARDPENAAARRKEASRANAAGRRSEASRADEASRGNAAARAKEAAPSAALRRAALDPAVDPPPRAEKREDPNRNAELAASADRRGNVRRARRSAS